MTGESPARADFSRNPAPALSGRIPGGKKPEGRVRVDVCPRTAVRQGDRATELEQLSLTPFSRGAGLPENFDGKGPVPENISLLTRE